jgi:23S rRNA pseudouridine2605 synthase
MCSITIEITEGRNRQIRKMIAAVNNHVIKLTRISFAGITLDNLKKGDWAYLNKEELALLSRYI